MGIDCVLKAIQKWQQGRHSNLDNAIFEHILQPKRACTAKVGGHTTFLIHGSGPASGRSEVRKEHRTSLPAKTSVSPPEGQVAPVPTAGLGRLICAGGSRLGCSRVSRDGDG